MDQIALTWNEVESKSTLTNVIVGAAVADEILTEDPKRWGFFKLPNENILIIGYANLGLSPVATLVGHRLFVGIDEVVACFDVNTLQRRFSYRLPTVFHEFISLSNRIIVRDEIGFVGISPEGEECWKFFTSGPIRKFFIEPNRVYGETIDDEPFEFAIPSDELGKSK